ncbi:MAG: helix-turn-helix domain-containing protein [Deltaproteobacteria bacterium]|nr:helix-turn-helix domain-containing protein [Deltaproteobacteria bacterium]
MKGGRRQTDGYLDLRKLAEYASLSVSSLRGYINRGSLPAFKLDGKILVRKDEFDAWVENFRITTRQDINGIVDEVMDALKG